MYALKISVNCNGKCPAMKWIVVGEMWKTLSKYKNYLVNNERNEGQMAKKIFIHTSMSCVRQAFENCNKLQLWLPL